MKFTEWKRVENFYSCGAEFPEDVKLYVAAEDGRCFDKTVPAGTVWKSCFPFWRTSCIIAEDKNDFILFSTRDKRKSFSSFELERTEKGSRITWKWSLASHLLKQGVQEQPPKILFNSFRTLQEAVKDYKKWMDESWPINHAYCPDWLRKTKTVVMLELWTGTGYITHDFKDMLNLIRKMQELKVPEDTIIYFWGWHAPFDTKYPEYWPAKELGGEEGFKAIADAARQAHYHLLPHCNWWGMDASLPEFENLKDDQVRSPSGERCGWRSPGEPAIEYIRPASKKWQKLFSEKISKFTKEFNLEAIFLDQMATFGDDPGCDFETGVREYISELQKVCPDILFAGEIFHERFRNLPLWQFWGTPWCGLELREEIPHSDILKLFFGEGFRTFSHMGMPSAVPVNNCWPAYYWYIDRYGLPGAAERANNFHKSVGAIQSVRLNFRKFGIDKFAQKVLLGL